MSRRIVVVATVGDPFHPRLHARGRPHLHPDSGTPRGDVPTVLHMPEPPERRVPRQDGTAVEIILTAAFLTRDGIALPDRGHRYSKPIRRDQLIGSMQRMMGQLGV